MTSTLCVVAWIIHRGQDAVGPPGEGFAVIEWPRHTTPDEAARLLIEAGLAADGSSTALYLRMSKATEEIAPGPHIVPRGRPLRELLEILKRSENRAAARLTIPEGFTRFDVAKRAERLGITPSFRALQASADPVLLESLSVPAPDEASPTSAEGFLFPATYELPLNLEAGRLIERLVRESNSRWERLAEQASGGVSDLASQLGWSRREITVLASMVEKEAAVAEERAIVASVFLNRLTDPTFTPKRLQSDPTAAYGCLAHPNDAPACATFAGKVTPAINRDPLNRYSTYTNDGLPPGPICNPGQAALAAVLEPADTRFFYFVAVGNGRHHFSEDYEEHKRVIADSKR